MQAHGTRPAQPADWCCLHAAAGLAGARAGLGGGGVAGLNPALQQQGLANRAAGAGGMAGLSAGGLGGYGANLAALQVRGASMGMHTVLLLLVSMAVLGPRQPAHVCTVRQAKHAFYDR